MNRLRSDMLKISQPQLLGNEEKYVVDAIRSTWISSQGSYINRFEESFATYIGTEYAVTVSNGTCALHLALMALNIGPGDEVIVPSLTFAASINAIIHAGATPVLVDCAEHHWNLDPAQARIAISPRTKAIMPVHLYGHPCDMKAITELAAEHKLFIIEDAAEAIGAEAMNKKTGSLGSIGCFSFYGNKVLSTGEGGMCTTDDPKLNARLRILRDHGMNKLKRYWHDEVGYNFRMTNISAAIGLAQLEQLEGLLSRRSHLASIYARELNSIPGLRIYPNSPFGKKSEWLFCAFIDEESSVMQRDKLIDQLTKLNIETRPTFYPVHLMPPYQTVKKIGDLANSGKFGLRGLNLPLYPGLLEEDIYYVTEAIKEVMVNKEFQSSEIPCC